MPSKQFEHLQETTRLWLAARIPPDCPLMVSRPPRGGFTAWTIDQRDSITGRAQVVAAWIDGYVAAWRRTRPPSPEPPTPVVTISYEADACGCTWQAATTIGAVTFPRRQIGFCPTHPAAPVVTTAARR